MVLNPYQVNMGQHALTKNPPKNNKTAILKYCTDTVESIQPFAVLFLFRKFTQAQHVDVAYMHIACIQLERSNPAFYPPSQVTN